MDIRTSLNEEILSEIEVLKGVKELGTDTYKTIVDGVTKLIDRSVELEKLDIERENHARENDLKRKQMSEEQKSRLISNCLTVANIVIPSVITIWGVMKSFEFEKEGTVTTIMGRGFVNKLLPRK